MSKEKKNENILLIAKNELDRAYCLIGNKKHIKNEYILALLDSEEYTINELKSQGVVEKKFDVWYSQQQKSRENKTEKKNNKDEQDVALTDSAKNDLRLKKLREEIGGFAENTNDSVLTELTEKNSDILEEKGDGEESLGDDDQLPKINEKNFVSGGSSDKQEMITERESDKTGVAEGSSEKEKIKEILKDVEKMRSRVGVIVDELKSIADLQNRDGYDKIKENLQKFAKIMNQILDSIDKDPMSSDDKKSFMDSAIEIEYVYGEIEKNYKTIIVSDDSVGGNKNKPDSEPEPFISFNVDQSGTVENKQETEIKVDKEEKSYLSSLSEKAQGIFDLLPNGCKEFFNNVIKEGNAQKQAKLSEVELSGSFSQISEADEAVNRFNCVLQKIEKDKENLKQLQEKSGDNNYTSKEEAFKILDDKKEKVTAERDEQEESKKLILYNIKTFKENNAKLVGILTAKARKKIELNTQTICEKSIDLFVKKKAIQKVENKIDDSKEYKKIFTKSNSVDYGELIKKQDKIIKEFENELLQFLKTQEALKTGIKLLISDIKISNDIILNIENQYLHKEVGGSQDKKEIIKNMILNGDFESAKTMAFNTGDFSLAGKVLAQISESGENVTEDLKKIPEQLRCFYAGEIALKLAEDNYRELEIDGYLELITNNNLVDVQLKIKKIKEKRGKDKEDSIYARSASEYTLSKLDKYEEVNAKTEEESDEKFIEKSKELWKEFAVHGTMEFDKKSGKRILKSKTDLDAQTCLDLLKLAGVDTSNVEYIKNGESVKGKMHYDVGGRHGVVYEDDTFYSDHHAPESEKDSSATKFTYEMLVSMGMLEKDENIDKAINFITRTDNKTYPEYHTYFNDSYRTVLGLERFMNLKQLREYFEENEDPTRVLSDDEIKQMGLEKVSQEQREIVEKAKERTDQAEKDGFVVDSGKYGKIVVDLEKKIRGGYDVIKANGYDGYMIWSPKNQSFFISSSEDIGDEDYEKAKTAGGKFKNAENKDEYSVIRVRKKMLLKKSADTGPLKISLDELLGIMTDENFIPEGKLKEFINKSKQETTKPVEKKKNVEKFEEVELVKDLSLKFRAIHLATKNIKENILPKFDPYFKSKKAKFYTERENCLVFETDKKSYDSYMRKIKKLETGEVNLKSDPDFAKKMLSKKSDVIRETLVNLFKQATDFRIDRFDEISKIINRQTRHVSEKNEGGFKRTHEEFNGKIHKIKEAVKDF